MLGERCSGRRAYRRNRPARILFTVDLAEELADPGIRVNALHRAMLTGTNITHSAGLRTRCSVEEGVVAEARSTVPEDVGGGGYGNGVGPARAHRQSYGGLA